MQHRAERPSVHSTHKEVTLLMVVLHAHTHILSHGDDGALLFELKLEL